MIRLRDSEVSRSMASRIALVVNMRTHANQQHPERLRRLEGLIDMRDHAVTPRSLGELEAACARFAIERPDVVAICGGDGTLHQTLSALIRSYGERALPPIMILPGGTMNIAATSLGIRGDPVEHLRALVSLRQRGGLAACLAGRGDTSRRPLELFEQALLRIEDRYGFLFGTGVIHAFLQAYYATGAPSAVTAARLLLRAAGSTLVGGALARRLCRPLRARVVADGRTWPRDQFVTICAATIEQIGLGFRPFYRCRDHADGFAVLGIHATPLGLLRELPRVRAGKPIRPGKVIDEMARAVAIAPLDPGELGYTLDGDLYACDGGIRIERGPVLRLVRPVLRASSPRTAARDETSSTSPGVAIIAG